jgi:hypothetical protein
MKSGGRKWVEGMKWSVSMTRWTSGEELEGDSARRTLHCTALHFKVDGERNRLKRKSRDLQ